MRKDERIMLRVTSSDKDSMLGEAEQLGVGLTSYFELLHHRHQKRVARHKQPELQQVDEGESNRELESPSFDSFLSEEERRAIWVFNEVIENGRQSKDVAVELGIAYEDLTRLIVLAMSTGNRVAQFQDVWTAGFKAGQASARQLAST